MDKFLNQIKESEGPGATRNFSYFKEILDSTEEGQKDRVFNQEKAFMEKAKKSVLRNRDDHVIDKYLYGDVVSKKKNIMRKTMKKAMIEQIQDYARSLLPDVNDPVTFNALITALQKKPEQRSEQDIALIMPYIRNINFFKNVECNPALAHYDINLLQTKLSKDDYRYICEHIKLQCYNPGDYVFHKGDFGTEFFIIIKGKVSVLVPKRKLKSKILGNSPGVPEPNTNSKDDSSHESLIDNEMSSIEEEVSADNSSETGSYSDSSQSPSQSSKNSKTESQLLNKKSFKLSIQDLETPEGSKPATPLIEPKKENLNNNKTIKNSPRLGIDTKNLSKRRSSKLSQKSSPRSKSGMSYLSNNTNTPLKSNRRSKSFLMPVDDHSHQPNVQQAIKKLDIDSKSAISEMPLPEELIKFINSLYDDCEQCHQIVANDTEINQLLKQCQKLHKHHKKIRLSEIVSKWHYALECVGLKNMENIIYRTFQYMALAVKGIQNITYGMQLQAIEIIVKDEFIQHEKIKMLEEEMQKDINMKKGRPNSARKKCNELTAIYSQGKLNLLNKGLSEKATNQYKQAIVQIKSITAQNICKIKSMTNGEGFGELALLSNGFRAATIKCLKECTLGVLSKTDFQNSVGKIMKRQMEKTVNFLRNCPQFSHWSKTAIGKLLYYLKKESFIKNQVVYHQGSPCSKVYIVLKGEFQLSISENIAKPYVFKHQAYTGPENQREIIVKQTKNQQNHCKNVTNISISSEGTMFGEEDAMAMQDYSKTARCYSQTGELFYINVSDFFQRIKFNEETWEFLQKSARLKFLHDKKVTGVSEKMKFKKVKKNAGVIIPKDDIIKPNDFFDLNFSGGPIPHRKLDRVMNRLRNAPLDENEVPMHIQAEIKNQPKTVIKLQAPKKVVELNADMIIGKTSSTLKIVEKPNLPARRVCQIQGVVKAEKPQYIGGSKKIIQSEKQSPFKVVSKQSESNFYISKANPDMIEVKGKDLLNFVKAGSSKSTRPNSSHSLKKDRLIFNNEISVRISPFQTTTANAEKSKHIRWRQNCNYDYEVPPMPKSMNTRNRRLRSQTMINQPDYLKI